MATSFSDDIRRPADRIATRHGFETRIRIRLERDGQTVTLQGWTRDLSESGLSAFVAQPFSWASW